MAERLSKLSDDAMTTLEDVMEFIGMNPGDREIPDMARNGLERLINAASSYIERMTDRKFRIQNYVENHYGSGGQELCLNQYPIKSVESVKDNRNGKIIDPESYSFADTGEIGILYRDAGWADQTYIGGLAYDKTASRRYLRVSYCAGYILPKDADRETPADLPYDLQYVIWQMVQQQWNLAGNGANGLAAFSISDISWTFDKELGTQVKDIISRYMRWA